MNTLPDNCYFFGEEPNKEIQDYTTGILRNLFHCILQRKILKIDGDLFCYIDIHGMETSYYCKCGHEIYSEGRIPPYGRRFRKLGLLKASAKHREICKKAEIIECIAYFIARFNTELFSFKSKDMYTKEIEDTIKIYENIKYFLESMDINILSGKLQEIRNIFTITQKLF
jgi:hypothetical protein